LLFVWNNVFVNLFVWLGLCAWNYGDDALVAATLLEVYYSIYKCIESIVLADAHIVAWVVVSAALANDDVACYYALSTPDLYA